MSSGQRRGAGAMYFTDGVAFTWGAGGTGAIGGAGGASGAGGGGGGGGASGASSLTTGMGGMGGTGGVGGTGGSLIFNFFISFFVTQTVVLSSRINLILSDLSVMLIPMIFFPLCMPNESDSGRAERFFITGAAAWVTSFRLTLMTLAFKVNAANIIIANGNTNNLLR